MTIGAVTISPDPVIVNQPVTITIQLNNYNKAVDQGKTIKVTINASGDIYASPEPAISNDGTASFTFTPDHTGTYTYRINKVSSAGEDKSGSFVVSSGFSFRTVTSLPVDDDGNILALADGYSRVTLVAAVMDNSGNVVRNLNYHMTINGANATIIQDSKGQAYLTIGPYDDWASIYVTADAAGYGSKTLHICFLENATIQISTNVGGSPPAVMPGSSIEVTARLKNNSKSLVHVPVIFREIMSNGTIAIRTLYTDDNGQFVVDCPAGLKAGNNIFTAQMKGLSLVDTTSVRTITSDLNDFAISALPSNMVEADDGSRHKIVVQIMDAYGNNIKDSVGVDVRFEDEYGHIYTTQPNNLGVAYAWSDPSHYPGRLNYTITVDTGSKVLTKDYTVYYIVCDPASMIIDAYPDVIASSNVRNSNITYQMNQSELVARMVDDNGNPVAFQPVNLTINDASKGALTPDNGYTDASGEFRSTFKLARDITGTGYVLINGTCGGASPDYSLNLTYTETSHLNISTIVDPRQVKPNDLVNVTVRVDGVGWDNTRPPADVMLVMDRSGSMGDAIGFTNYSAGDNGGWFGATINNSLTDPVDKNSSISITYNHNKATRLIFKISQTNPPFAGNAVYVSDDIPTSMIAGKTYTVNVTMRNTGDIIWNETNMIRLAGSSASGENGNKFLNSSNRVYLPPDVNVCNGDTYTFTFNMTAPTVYTTTNYAKVYYRMYCDYTGATGWFGTYQSKTVTVNPDPSAPNAVFVSSTIPESMVTGQFYDVSVTFRNTGNADWNSATKLAYDLSNDAYFWIGNNPANINPINVFYIPAGVTVHNGESYTFNFTMRGPFIVSARSLSVQFQMSWDVYGKFGTASPNKAIRITPDPAAYPNAEFVSVNITTPMISGQTVSSPLCNITLRNTGGLPWSSANGTRIYLRGDSPNLSVPDSVSIPSGTVVMPGDTFTFSFKMTAPVVTASTDYSNAWYAMYMDNSIGPFGSSWFGPSYPMGTLPKITVLPVPRVSALYGDWYSYKLITPSSGTFTGNAGTDLANPDYTSGLKVLKNGAAPKVNSSGSDLTVNSYAPIGNYVVQITRNFITSPEQAYQAWIWDNMKMGQLCDQDAMAKVAAKKFIDPDSDPRNIYAADRVGLVTFGTDATLNLPLKNMNGANITNLKSAISTINSYGETNTAAALRLAVDEFAAKPNPEQRATRHIILLTDGYSTSTAEQNEEQVQRVIDGKIKVYAIGIADDEGKVDSAFLNDLATRSGGQYFFVKDMPQLLAAYNAIGQIIKETITETSTIGIQIEQDERIGNTTEYVPGSAYTMLNDSAATLKQVEPTINGNTMSWVVDPIKLGYNWTLTYNVTANANFKGFTHPVGNGSVGHFSYDGMVNDSSFMSEAIYVNDNNVSSSDMINVNITTPEEGDDILNSTFDMRWNVAYNATPLTYTQIIEYAPTGTDNYVRLVSGFAGSTSNQYRYLIDLDKLSIRPGLYTFKIYATNGLFEAGDVRNLTVVYEHGPKGYITIGSKT